VLDLWELVRRVVVTAMYRGIYDCVPILLSLFDMSSFLITVPRNGTAVLIWSFWYRGPPISISFFFCANQSQLAMLQNKNSYFTRLKTRCIIEAIWKFDS
jgi:hypothetical protein